MTNSQISQYIRHAASAGLRRQAQWPRVVFSSLICFFFFRILKLCTIFTAINYRSLEGHSVERMYLRQRPKSEYSASLTPSSSANIRRTEKSIDLSWPFPGPWTTTWSKQYLSAVLPVTYSLLWVRCLLDRLRQIFDFQIFRFRHPDYDPDRAQKLISSSMSRHLSTRKISSKYMHAFLSNLSS